jgi:hypothetical protein
MSWYTLEKILASSTLLPLFHESLVPIAIGVFHWVQSVQQTGLLVSRSVTYTRSVRGRTGWDRCGVSAANTTCTSVQSIPMMTSGGTLISTAST